MSNEEKLTEFQKETFDKIVSAVENGIEKQFQATKQIVDQFDFLWTYKQTNEKELEDEICRFAFTYPNVEKDELFMEAKHLNGFHDSNFGIPTVMPLDFSTKLKPCISNQSFQTSQSLYESSSSFQSLLHLPNNHSGS